MRPLAPAPVPSRSVTKVAVTPCCELSALMAVTRFEATLSLLAPLATAPMLTPLIVSAPAAMPSVTLAVVPAVAIELPTRPLPNEKALMPLSLVFALIAAILSTEFAPAAIVAPRPAPSSEPFALSALCDWRAMRPASCAAVELETAS